MKIIWLASGRQSLRAQLDFVASDNSAAARRVRHRIHVAIRNLGRFPESGRHGEIACTHELVVPGLPYLVVYRVGSDRLEILRVFHTSQDRANVMN